MSITRRQFIKRTGLATAGTVIGSSLFSNPLLRQALAQTIGDRYLVVLFLDGGNDGLNTVSPRSNGGATLRDAYEAARGSGAGGIRLPIPDLDANAIGNDPGSGAGLGIHPGFQGFSGLAGFGGLKSLYDAGKVAVIQGCGYPDYSLSHEEARIIWQTGNPAGLTSFAGTGWVGRHLADPATGNYGGLDIPGVTIGDSVAAELRQNTTSVLALTELRNFGFPFDDDYSEDNVAKAQAFMDLYGIAGGPGQPPRVEFLGNSGLSTQAAANSYPALHDLYVADRGAFDAMYDDLGRSTGRDLREIAKIIYGVEQGADNVSAHFFQLSNGGYDTHSDQGASTGSQADLHGEVGAALKIFYDDLADMGAADKVAVLVWSEFSRRVPQNDNGTDHGSQGPMFLIGGKVNGGVYGNHPNINEAALDDEGNTVYSQNANPFRSTDFRDVYGTIFTKWLNMSSVQAQALLPLDAGPASLYWTVPNFNLNLFTP